MRPKEKCVRPLTTLIIKLSSGDKPFILSTSPKLNVYTIVQNIKRKKISNSQQSPIQNVLQCVQEYMRNIDDLFRASSNPQIL